MAGVLVFDIETIPDAAGIRRLEGIPDSVSDLEVVTQALAARKEKTGTEFMPLHLQKVVAISCVIRRTTKEGLPQFKVGSLAESNSSEKEIIQAFFDLIEKYTPQLVSWNGSGFDLPVLHYRALVNGVTSSRYWEMGESGDSDSRDFKWNNYISRYHMRHIDLMDLLAKFSGRANAPLDALAKMCGFPGKMGMDGGQVWQGFLDGKIKEIRDYCETDVVNTYLLYCRFQRMRGGVTSDEYEDEIKFVKEELLKESKTPSGTFWMQYLELFAADPKDSL
jgi:hypothetical protein